MTTRFPCTFGTVKTFARQARKGERKAITVIISIIDIEDAMDVVDNNNNRRVRVLRICQLRTNTKFLCQSCKKHVDDIKSKNGTKVRYYHRHSRYIKYRG